MPPYLGEKHRLAMAHWDEERDRRLVATMRQSKEATGPEMKILIDQFEGTGDIIYWSRFICELRKRWFEDKQK